MSILRTAEPQNQFASLNFRFFLWACSLAGIIFAVYIPSLKAPFIFDDQAYVVNNPDIRELAHLKDRLVFRSDHYLMKNDPARPVTFLTFALNYHFSGLNPAGFRVTNVFFHACAAGLLFLFVRVVYFRAFGETGLLFPWLASLLFALHPLQTEVAAYVSHRSESLAAAFFLLSLILFISDAGTKWFFRGASFLCFALALLSKQTAATLPAILLAYDYIFMSDFKWIEVRKKWDRHAPYWVLLLGYLSFRAAYFGKMGDWGLATHARWTPLSYFAVQPYAIVQYLKLLIAPVGQCVDHYLLPLARLEPRHIFSYVALPVLAALPFAFKNRSRGAFKIYLFSVLWFFIVLAPTSSFVPILDAMAERRAYLPGMAFFMCLPIILAGLLSLEAPFARTTFRTQVLAGILIVQAIALTAFTLKRNQLYVNPEAMWEDVLRQYPENDRPYLNLAGLSVGRGDLSRAEAYLKEAVRLHPEHFVALNNLGVLFFKRKDYSNAEFYFSKALEQKPDYAEAAFNLGNLYFAMGKKAQAVSYYNKALAIDPGHAGAKNNLGVVSGSR